MVLRPFHWDRPIPPSLILPSPFLGPCAEVVHALLDALEGQSEDGFGVVVAQDLGRVLDGPFSDDDEGHELMA
jgi:hypothetical protein